MPPDALGGFTTPLAAEATGQAPLLVARGITRAFSGNLANDHIGLVIKPGRLHALLGENGAGKTTLISILSGQYRADAGEIFIRGKAVELRSPREGLRAGVGVVYQDFWTCARERCIQFRLILPPRRP